MPLVEYTWGRDIDLRTDVTIADEVASFTNNSVASAGGLGTGNGIGNGKSWMQKNTTQVTSQDVDISKTPQPRKNKPAQKFCWLLIVSMAGLRPRFTASRYALPWRSRPIERRAR